MIIVSQEKDGIINFDNVLVIRLSIDFETNKKTIIYVDCVGDEHFGIGKYDTEERAKEILQEIIDMYKFNRCEAVGQKNAVYRMPEG